MTDATKDVAAVPLDAATPFSRTALWVIAGLVIASLAAVVALTIFSEDMERPPSNGADGYSASAIGHRGLIKVLQALDIPVVVSQGDSAAKARDGLLVIAEPVVTDDESGNKLRDMVTSAHTVLLILPKWWTTPNASYPEWAHMAELIPTADVDAVFAALGIDGAALGRNDQPLKAAPAEGLGLPGVTVKRMPQMVVGGDLESVYWASDSADSGAILGTIKVGEAEVTILSDPDVINNHGLDEGHNARFAVGLIEQLRHGGPVVFDEVGHGYTMEPSLWSLLFRWPLVLATLSSALCILVLVLATIGRFGPARASDGPIAPGKDFLIRNTAALLRYGGHDGEALRRYFTSSVHQVRAVIHAPRDLTAGQMMEWLERIRVARKGTVALPDLDRDVAAAAADPALHKKIPELAMRIHRWRKEMTHGSGHHS